MTSRGRGLVIVLHKQVCAKFFIVSLVTQLYRKLRKSAKFRIYGFAYTHPYYFEMHFVAEICIQIRKTMQKSASISAFVLPNFMDTWTIHKSASNLHINAEFHIRIRKCGFLSAEIRIQMHICICKCEPPHYICPQNFKVISHLSVHKALVCDRGGRGKKYQNLWHHLWMVPKIIRCRA